MKAPVEQQRVLAHVVEIDAELARIAHRRAHLPELQRHEEVRAQHAAATDRVSALELALEDVEEQVKRFESEIDAVRQREERDRSLLTSGRADAKQLTDLQHELETLQRRQASLEDSLLEVMERREELQLDQSRELKAIEALQGDLAAVESSREGTLAEMDATVSERSQRRTALMAGLDPDLVALYERQRTSAGVGAGLLQGKRCGACRIELDRGELARISAAADDDVLRCPECRAILLRIG
ncbi:MAG TPA: C4-type zinc ribbon domain-containing protein [Mycobacterium sp.]|nr:C4-type zinc ribbon domain-containing protein [Mycobacterium sp.]